MLCWSVGSRLIPDHILDVPLGPMKCPDRSFVVTGAGCNLVLFPVGPTWVNALSGSNVTLAVSFSGALDPVVTWIMGNVIVITWTINSSSPPDVAENFRKVLRLEQNGSLSFVNVPLGYSGTYTMEMTKPGLSKAVTSFTLKVFGEYLEL